MLRLLLPAFGLYLLVAAITIPGLLLIGSKYALLLGVIAGLTDIIPYFGPILGLIPALLLAIAIVLIEELYLKPRR